ncbi:hypothetical protein L8V80_07755, partial [Campylobacter lari]|nr:hypothetical protein [Campylobacter lari]
DMQAFADMKTLEQGAAFSPVFNPHKAGNVVNMGNINANDVLLIGNKVDIQGGNINGKHNDNVSGDALKNPSGNIANKVHLVGNEVNILVDGIKSDSIVASAYVKGFLQQSTTSYYNYGNNIGKLNFITQEYDNIDKTNLGNKKLVTKDKFEKHAIIGSDVDWWHFAKGWNEDKNGMRDFFSTYKLVDDIDFGGNQGKGKEGKDWQNYANYCIDGYGCTNMIVGFNGDSAFTKTFDGQGYTLKNINIDTTGFVNNKSDIYVGIFGIADGAKFKNINVDYMGGGIKHSNNKDLGSDFIGGLLGYSVLSNYDNISLKNIQIDIAGSLYVGGIVGTKQGGNSNNIYLYNIYITARGIRNTIGGFAGSTIGNSNQDFFNRNIYLSKINLNGFDVSGRIGGFAGIVDFIDSENIYLNNITLNGTGTELWIGGFAGSFTANCNNIFLNNININFNNSGGSLIGGFAGDTLSIGEELKIENVFLQDIDIINKGESDNYIGGGFIGFNGRSPIYFSNIVLDQLYIDSKKNGYTGGFIGYYETDSDSFYPSEFKNIFIFFKENTKISSGQVGKFFGKIEKESIKSLSNIHIYHHENDLSNAIADQNYWNDFNNGYVSDKINIHTYNNSNKDEVYKDFQNKANTISKPMLPIMPPPSKPTDPTDPTDPSNPDVILDSDDVISAEDLNKWLDEIFGGNYWVDIKDLSKIQGLSESIAQSISFLEALYGQKGMKEILEKFHDDYKIVYSKYDKFKTNKANLLAFINDKLKPLVESSNNALAQLKLIQDQLKIAIAKYNDYVKKINENPAIKNEETLNALKAEVDRLNQLSGELATTIVNNQIQLEDWQDKASADSNEHFTIKGQFDNVALLIPDLEKVTTNGNENDDYEKISRQVANIQKQTPVFEYEDEETEEVDETSLAQKSKTCIVSDNYKTMNPCVVGGL